LGTQQLHPPFLHPRRDGHFAGARRMSAIFLSIAQAAWFVTFIIAIESGTELDMWVSLLGLVGLFLIASKTRLMGEIALAEVDRKAGLTSAPAPAENLRRFLLGVVLPFALLGLAFAARDRPGVMIGLLAVAAGIEIALRVGMLRGSERGRIHTPTLRALLTETPEQALKELRGAEDLTDAQLEASALAVAGVAIRQHKADVLAGLEDDLEQRAQKESGRQSFFVRLRAVVRADHMRLVDPENAGPAEAEALRLVPAGHPRRLALGLFVATAALDQQDPQSALKALTLLHTRDAMFSTARVLINWLMLQAARQSEDVQLAERCSNAMKTFDLRREALRLNMENLGSTNDPYARWMIKAREDMMVNLKEK
jgi:hypothetical protein